MLCADKMHDIEYISVAAAADALDLIEGGQDFWQSAPNAPLNDAEWYSDAEKAKVHFRRAAVFKWMGSLDLAYGELEDAKGFAPGDKGIEGALKEVQYLMYITPPPDFLLQQHA